MVRRFFHHIGDTGRRSQIVLEDSELSRLVSDQVDTRDVNSHTVGRHDAGRFTVEVLARGHQAARQHVIAQDSLLAVNVREEQLERLHSLLDTLFQPRPLLGGDGRVAPDPTGRVVPARTTKTSHLGR